MATRADGLPHSVASARRNHPLSQSIVAGIAGLSDFVISVVTGLLLYAGYLEPGVQGRFTLYGTVIGIFSLLAAQSLHAAGLYRFENLMAPWQHVGRQIAIYILVFLLLLSVGFALKISTDFSRVWAFSWVTVVITLSVVSRIVIASVVRSLARTGRIRRNIVVYGAGHQGERLIRHIQSLNEPWNHVIGVFDDRLGGVGPDVAGRPLIGNLSDLLAWARRNRADEVLIALPWSAEKRLLSIMRSLAVLPTNVRLSPEFVGLDRLHCPTSHQFNVPMLNVIDKPLSAWGALFKYSIDRVLGLFLVALTLPLMSLIAIAIGLESRGPVLFRQQRLGFNHRLIQIYKFRTMYADRVDPHAENLTVRDDSRVTKVGAILRRFSLDELPQLFNVLRGEMSVVGPRPHALQAKAGGKPYEEVIAEYANRYKVKPGITGWAQVNGWRGYTATEHDLIGRVEHDLYYIEHWSVLFDLSIMLRTVWAVVRGKNSY